MNDRNDPEEQELTVPDGLVGESSGPDSGGLDDELQRATDAGALDESDVPGRGIPADRIPAAGITGQTGAQTDSREAMADSLLDDDRDEVFDADREVIADNVDGGVALEDERERHGDPEMPDADPRDPRSELDFAGPREAIPEPLERGDGETVRDDDRDALGGDPVLGEPDNERLDEQDRDATAGPGLDERAGDPAIQRDRHVWRGGDPADSDPYDGTDAVAHDRSDAPVNEAAAEQADVAGDAAPLRQHRTTDESEAHG